MSGNSASSLAPGFRFHPTDEELVRYYLKRKILNKPSFDAISVIDIYRSEPWDLPVKSKLKSRDLEWYFFSALDKKYGNGSRTNRATEKGYWKTTGKDRPVRHGERVVGMKKTLVYHRGRAPRGERTNWVMHEYRLTDEALEAGIQRDAFVLCRVFQKSGSGPKNGEQYGAPFIEEEWEDDEAVILPGQLTATVYEEVANDDAFVEVNDIDQNLDAGNPSENAALPLNYYCGESSNHVEYSREFREENQKAPCNISQNVFLPSNFCYGESSNSAEHSMKLSEDHLKPTLMHATENDSRPHHELEPAENINPSDSSYLLEETYLDVSDYGPTNDGFFLEANDLLLPIDLDEYLTFNDADDQSLAFDPDEYLTFDDTNDQSLAFDPDQLVGSEIPVSGQEPLAQMCSNGGTEQVSNASEHIEEHGNSDASSSKQEPGAAKSDHGTKYSFLKQASEMLGSFPAPPAFASEFPSKDAALKLNSAANASSSAHVMAGMIRITNITSSGNGLDLSHSKDGNVNIVLSFSLPQGDINSSSFLPIASLLSGKTRSIVAGGWFFLMLLSVLIISVSFKFGTCTYTR